MENVRKYCKAYQLKNLRLFPFWHEQYEAEEELVDDTIVYLWDDFTVVKNPVSDEQGGTLEEHNARVEGILSRDSAF